MKQNTEKTLVEVAFGRPAHRTPVWFLRQAGRYLPEYRAIRAAHSFLDVCTSPAMIAEVTLQPLARYDLDAAIIFSDILVPAMAMGQKLEFAPDHGPRLSLPIRSAADLLRLKIPNMAQEAGFLGEGLNLVKSRLSAEKTLIGFAGAPFTVASYMIEGQGSKTFSEVKRLLFNDPKTFVQLLEHIAAVTIDYIKMQVEAGADAVMYFDTWANQVARTDFEQYVYPVTRQLLAQTQLFGIPVIYYPGMGSDQLFALAGMSMDVVAVDWRVPLDHGGAILSSLGLECSIQGNLDPQVLIGPEELVRSRVRDILDRGHKAGARGHIFNVGHGLLPNTPAESLSWVVDEVRKYPR